MSKLIYIIGNKGNMAKRYIAILNELNIPHLGHDLDGSWDMEGLARSSAVIVATPTDTHFKVINELGFYDKPILCEKPITKSMDELKSLLKRFPKLGMVNQYIFMTARSFLPNSWSTNYSYFKSGTDGLYWDCINIIGLAKADVMLSNDSCIWKCRINGNQMSLADIDKAYVDMLGTWVYHPDNLTDHKYILNAHQKVHECLSRL